MPTSSKTVFLELIGTSVFEQGERGRGFFVEHPWTKELLEKYQIKIFSNSDLAQRYADKWHVELMRKTEGATPLADFLIDADCANSGDLCSVINAYTCIEDFFFDQEPNHPVGKRIYLDDVRETPRGWIRAYWPDQVSDHLDSGNVTQVSLDHDLGETRLLNGRALDGNDVVTDIERRVHETDFQPPIMLVHAGNVTRAPSMEQGIEEIWRHVSRREEYLHPKKTGFFVIYSKIRNWLRGNG
jgi:hypothetical protein